MALGEKEVAFAWAEEALVAPGEWLLGLLACKEEVDSLCRSNLDSNSVG